MTRRDTETYEAFVLRAGDDLIGHAVKLADLEDNCDLGRITVPSEKDYARIERYRRAIAQLREQEKQDADLGRTIPDYRLDRN